MFSAMNSTVQSLSNAIALIAAHPEVEPASRGRAAAASGDIRRPHQRHGAGQRAAASRASEQGARGGAVMAEMLCACCRRRVYSRHFAWEAHSWCKCGKPRPTSRHEAPRRRRGPLVSSQVQVGDVVIPGATLSWSRTVCTGTAPFIRIRNGSCPIDSSRIRSSHCTPLEAVATCVPAETLLLRRHVRT